MVKKLLGVQRSHAPETGGRHSLPIDVVSYVARGEHARNAGLGGHALQARANPDVTVGHIQLAFKQAGIRLVANRDKYAGQLEILRTAILGALDAHAGNAGSITEHFVQGVIPDDVDVAVFRFLEELVLQDFAGDWDTSGRLVGRDLHFAGDEAHRTSGSSGDWHVWWTHT